MDIKFILFAVVILIISYFIFFKKDTFINKKLENFEGDDLNVHNVEEHQEAQQPQDEQPIEAQQPQEA